MHELTNFVKFLDWIFFKTLDEITHIMHKMFVSLVLLAFLIINLPIILYKLIFFCFSALGHILLLDHFAYWLATIWILWVIFYESEYDSEYESEKSTAQNK